jgi:hypothetical protein
MLLQGHTFLDDEGTSERARYPGMQNNNEHDETEDKPWVSSFFTTCNLMR